MQPSAGKQHLKTMIVHRPAVNALLRARSATDDLFARVYPDSLYERPLPLRHRLIFYVGHVDAFDWNLISNHVFPLPSFDAEMNHLFAFGIDPAAGQAPSDPPSAWPELAQVREYCAHVRQAVDDAWDAVPRQLQNVCIEHRLMHAETLAYLLHNMPHDQLVAPETRESVDEAPVSQERLRIPGGATVLGKRSDDGFGWDNEFEEIRLDVPTFLIDRYKVTNGEYLRFVEQGGPAPHFWRQRDGRWFLRRMFDWVPLPLSWPVWTTSQHAAAYASWVGGVLPSEAQWHRAAYGVASGEDRPYPWGEAEPVGGRHGNFGAVRWDAAPVNSYPLGASSFGVEDMVGNGWEWTSTPFAPFPGFAPFSFYPGYSADFFDGEHSVLKGGSPRTDPVFLRRSFRNWFRSDYPYVFAGFRCAYKND